MERRSAIYRGAAREDAEAAYHDDALKSAADGFVPASETWSTALGHQVLTVDYVYQPDQAPVVISELRHLKTWPKPVNPPSGAPPLESAAPPLLNASPPVAKKQSNALGCLALIALAVVVWLAFSRGNSGSSADTTPPPAAAPEVSHLTGEFVRWEPVDEQNGYAHFSITNTGSATEVATCTISVSNDFGNFGFDSLVGEEVGDKPSRASSR